jgi:hypothetical protein
MAAVTGLRPTRILGACGSASSDLVGRRRPAPRPPEKALAEDLRRHVHEALGGLAHPSRVGFAAAFPPEVERRTLRAGLRLLNSDDDEMIWCASEEDIRKAVERLDAIGPC